MSSTYSSFSPYYKTVLNKGYLDVTAFRNIPNTKSDELFEITSKYEHRPDLLAYDRYGDSRLWWVFAVRNKNKIKDPIYDMVPGIKIYVPSMPVLKSELGI